MRTLIDAALPALAAVGQAGGIGSAEQAARWLWHDTLGCAWSGYQVPEVRALLALHTTLAPGAFVAPGSDALAPGIGATAAANLNAIAACWDEACEGLAVAHGRPGVPVVSALWALAAHRPLSWQRVLQATVLGYQVGGSLGAWLRILPGMHVDGFWPGLGVAAAVAWALELPPEGIVDAIETCACQLPASLYLPITQGSNARNGYLGHSAWLGLSAALSAAAGIAGPRGAVQAAAQRLLQRPAHEAPPLHGETLIEHAYWKPFACVRHVHYGARAAQQLRAQLPVADIEELVLTVYPEAITYCGNRAPASAIAAQFSLSHGVAAMLVHGELGPAQFRSAALRDPEVMRLEALVRIVADPARYSDGRRGATLAARAGGRWHRVDVDAVEGDAGHPPTPAQRDAKFLQLCGADPRASATAQRMLTAAPAADAGWVTGARAASPSP